MNFWMGKVQSKNVSAYDGAIFLCNRMTRKECFDRKIFGLSSKCTEFIHKVKTGATLFLYDVEQRKLHGVFEATSDGAMNIVPDAYTSSGFQYPCQIRFKRIWFCKPLLESEFEDAVQDNYFARNRFTYGLTHQQVVNLLHLFSSRNRLQPRQNPRLQDETPRESEISSVVNQTDNQSSSNGSSHGSLKSPCQTCTSSTAEKDALLQSHRLAEPMSLMHSEVQLDISDVAKSNSSGSSLHTAANTDIVTEPGTQEAMDDKSTDDYIPLQLDEDSDNADNLSDLLGDESYSSESKGSSDSEEHTTFHQPCGRKKDDFHQPRANSKLRADIEGRKSVFARLMGRSKSFYQREKSKTKPFPSMSKSKSSSLRTQKRKKRRAQKNTPFPCDNRAKFDIPLTDKMRRTPPLNYSFVWDDGRRSNKFSGGKPSNIQAGQRPYLREDVNEWDVPTKEPDQYDASKKLFDPEGSRIKLFDPEGSRKMIESCDTELNKLPVSAEVHESCGVDVKEEIRTPFLDLKRRDKDPNVEGGDMDFDTEDVEEAARKKTRLASASYHQEEYQSETALVAKDTKPMEILKTSDGSCKPKSISLLSNDTRTQMARAYLETEVLLQDEQQRTQGCREDVTGDKSLILNVETRSELAFGHLGTETSLQGEQNQSARTCYGVVNIDKMLLLEKPETMDLSSNHDEDCGSKMCSPSDGNTSNDASNHMVAEMPPQEKQTPDVQSCSQVVRGDEVVVPENSEEMFPQFDANCGRDKNLSSYEAYNTVEVSHLDTHMSLQEKPCQRTPSCCEIVNADRALCQENSVSLEASPNYDRHLAKNNLSSDGIGDYVAGDLYSSDASPDLDSPEPLINLPKCHGDGANKSILPDGNLEMASTDHQQACQIPQSELLPGVSGVASSVLEHSGTMDTSAGDEDSAHKTSFDQKDAEATYSPTGSENHEDTKLMDILTTSDGSCELKSIGLSSNDACTQMAGADVETEVLLQDGCCDKSPEDCGNVDVLPKLSFGSIHAIADENLEMASTDHQQACQIPQGELLPGVSGVASSVLEHSGTMDTSRGDGDSAHKTSFYEKDAKPMYSPTGSENHQDTKPMDIMTISDGSCELKSIGLSSNDACTQMAGADLESEVLLQDGCCEDVTGDKSPEDCGNVDVLPMLSFGSIQAIVGTGREVDVSRVETETSLQVQEKQNQSARSCYGVADTDKMLLLQNPGTVDLPRGEDIMYFGGGASSVLEYSGTVDTSAGSEDHGLGEAVPRLETPYQDLPSRQEAVHEHSDSTDPFAACADGYGSRSGEEPADGTSGHLVVADLLGTNAESRTGFFDGSSSGLAEMIMLAHDPGEEMEPH